MADKTKIKVIKRAEAKSTPRSRRQPRVKTTRQAARELASTVTDWVTDLKQRKADETRAALELLFSGQRPTES